MQIESLDSKSPSETISITFDFKNLVSSITSVTSVEIAVKTGTDASVGTMLLGPATLSGTSVIQLVRNGVDGVVYRVRVNIISGSQAYSLAVYLPVIELI